MAGSWAARLAYADPPYPGLEHYYDGHPDQAGPVDHGELLDRLVGFDGWALSTSRDALPEVWAMARDRAMGVELAVWVRGAQPGRSWRARSTWEPVLYTPARRELGELRDSLVAGPGPRTTDPGRVVGAKPPTFARWLFGLLGARAGDSLADLFPGSGGIARAWDEANRRSELSDSSGAVESRGATG